MCLTEIKNLQPSPHIPNPNTVINKFLRELARFVGGIPCTAVFVTTANVREYDSTTSGFPSDVQKTYRVYRTTDGFLLDQIFRRDRYDQSVSTGSPTKYYLWGKKIGFDLIPDSVISITWDYYGLGTTLTGETDVVWGTVPFQDADTVWDAIVFAFAEQYYRLTEQWDKMKFYQNEKLKAQWEARKATLDINADRLWTIDLPEHYFERSDTSSLRDRLANDGDVLRQL